MKGINYMRKYSGFSSSIYCREYGNFIFTKV